MSLQAGIYTVTNVYSGNRASLPNDDDRVNVVCKIPFTSSKVTDSEKWELTASSNGRYTIQNVLYKYYLTTTIRPKASAPIFGTTSPDWWTITEILPVNESFGQETYSILCKDHSNLGWALHDDDDETPIELQSFARDNRNLWKISPYPPVPRKEFPFTDRSILRLSSVEKTSEAECLGVQFEWKSLPPNFVLHFPEPLLIVHHSEVVAEVFVEDEFKTSSGILYATIRAKDTAAFTSFASSVLLDDDIQVSLQAHKFRYYPADPVDRPADWQYLYRLRWKKDMTFKGLHSFRERVILRDFRITASDCDSHGQFMRASVIANIMNASCFTSTATIAVGVYYGSSKVGTAEYKDLQLQPEKDNELFIDWKFRPLNPANSEVQNFMDQYFTTVQQLPVTLTLESISASICGHLFNLPHFDISTRIQGIGSKFIDRVDIYAGAWSSLIQRKVSFTFDIENPLDATLDICSIVVDVRIKGAHLASVKHTFGKQNANRFIIPPKEKAKSVSISDAWLVSGFIKSLQLAGDRNACLDITVKSATLRIDQFLLQGLTYNIENVPFKLHFNVL
ncbi:uncharacterized protein FIBRA_08972 [Fibroporia radiculosa]|uniref:Uncharacterized protein n=1 Tax=Fibroporia radiculosa TaxID=599839 RepID=J4GXQ3_9APHY|nr:uncharacterized protein FIBRA_08972 [Fibroporia radiculosa]CCM06685.1 predicted protein [Fibroporia radiculosa]